MLPVSTGSLVVPIVAVLLIRESLSARNLFIAICAVLVVGLICARVRVPGRRSRLIA